MIITNTTAMKKDVTKKETDEEDGQNAENCVQVDFNVQLASGITVAVRQLKTEQPTNGVHGRS